MSAAPGQETIDAALVRRLVSAQFPQWSELPVGPVTAGGWDNRTFHLGPHMTARLPSARRYAAQVEKEQAWLPRLAARLPLPIPEPLAMGAPGEGYPWRWSVYRWLPGKPAGSGRIDDPVRFAMDLARFLRALQDIDATDGPAAGPHSFWRGGPLATYDDETRAAIAALGPAVDAKAVTAVWDQALGATWRGPPVWVHGDLAVGNLLVENGALGAVIDFGCCAVGDPASDLAIAWTFLNGEARKAFRAALPLDADAWARGRGWVLWKALIVLAASPGANPQGRARAPRIIDDVLADHVAAVRARP